MPPQETTGSPHLALRVGASEYVVPTALVDAIGRLGPLRAVPGARPPVLGLTEWRGRVLTVVDLGALFGVESPAPCWLVRLAPPLGHTALAVATVPSLTDAPAGATTELRAALAELCGGGVPEPR